MYKLTAFKPKIFSSLIDQLKVYEFYDETPVKLDPQGNFEMIFQLDAAFSHNTANTDGWEERPKHFIGGLHTRSYLIQPKRKNAKVLSVQFKPEGTKYFVPDKLQLYKNKIVDLQEALGHKADEFLDKMQEALTLRDGMERIERLMQLLYQERSASVIDVALKLMNEQKTGMNIGAIAEKVNLSKAQFRKRFNEEIGMSPKEYCKIKRFNRAVNSLTRQPKIKLTSLAYELGYFDQAHFIKDFQSITNLTPKKYLQSPA